MGVINVTKTTLTTSTICCALNIMSATNNSTIEELQYQIDFNKKFHFNEKNKSFINVAKGYGARILTCVVSPGEKKLENNLIFLGFQLAFSFDRRKGYPKGKNKFYILKW
jgi:hypothetical protein